MMHPRLQIFRLFVAVFPCFTASCVTQKDMPQKLSLPFQVYSVFNPIQREADEIFSLLTYALVYADWQEDSIPRQQRRGYNIGAVLVDQGQNPVFAGLNCVNSTDNATQHGEVRAIMNYLEQSKRFNLDGFTIYTSLEPCIMCGGMMTMTDVDRVVYGQKDVDFSNGLERLALDTHPLGGYEPYKRITVSDPSPSSFKSALESAYREYLDRGEERILAKFLTGLQAKNIFGNASEAFLNFSVHYAENIVILDRAYQFYLENIRN